MNALMAGASVAAWLLLAGIPAASQEKKGGPAPHTAEGKVDLSGVWQVQGNPNLPGDPAYTPAYQKIYQERKAAAGKGDPNKACLPNGVVRIESLPYKIVQTPKLVVLLSEGNVHSYRRFFLEGHTHEHDLEIEPNTWNGNSIAKWDGDTLVVDTLGFNDKSWLDSTGKPHSEMLHVVERYRRPSMNRLEIAYTLEDSAAFAKPYSFTRTFNLVTGHDLHEYFCAMDTFVGK